MDQALRNKLRAAVTQCRRLLEEAVAQVLQGQFGIFPTGRKDEVQVEDAARMGHLSEEDRGYREQILIHLDHIQATGFKPQDEPTAPALQQMIREVAFTHLNRLCAYKLMETRGLIRESVGRVLKSQGFLFYLADHEEDERIHQSGQQDVAYRHFLRWLGGTLSEEVGVLFSPHDPANRLFPPQRVLEEVLGLINGEDLKSIWGEDEAIGWVYQYFTPRELRDQARKESAAPRNSYELAFRNQFFTPRYVVEFLTDNTLGRIWYEMRRGKTKLKDQCRYMVRRPSEVFLQEGESPPDAQGKDDLPQDELLKQPVYVSHRPKKDPREIKVLDPACGSAHFLLYCFDLLLVIYEEAYADPDLGPALKKDYPTLEDLRKALPGLILSHNLHGIDIDRRATQIAALALWLRALRAWSEMGVKKDRPKIMRTNIVCAEPMPGENDLLEEFLKTLGEERLEGLIRRVLRLPAEKRVRATRSMADSLCGLVRLVWDRMRLAGEAGSLLKIEEDLQAAIRQGQREWEDDQPLFRVTEFSLTEEPSERLYRFVPGDIDGERISFWDIAERLVLAALQDYARQATNGKGFQRQLFAGDAERGFAFVDVCRQKFDVVLMNPPFGKGSTSADSYLRDSYSDNWKDLYAAFIERCTSGFAKNGYTGCITSSLFMYTKQLRALRAAWVAKANLLCLAELGAEVLDTAAVETALTVTVPYRVSQTLFSDLNSIEEKVAGLGRMVLFDPDFCVLHSLKRFENLFAAPFCYHMSDQKLRLWEQPSRLDPDYSTVALGNHTFDDERFLRLRWEISPSTIGKKWFGYEKGGEYQPYYSPTPLLLNWESNGEELRAFEKDRHGTDAQVIQSISLWWKPGITYPRVTSVGFGPRAMPKGHIFGSESISIFPHANSHLLPLLGFLCSSWAEDLIQAFGRYRKIENRAVSNLPLSEGLLDRAVTTLGNFAQTGVRLLMCIESWDETSALFFRPEDFPTIGQGDQTGTAKRREEVAALLCQLAEDGDMHVGNYLFGASQPALSVTRRSELVNRVVSTNSDQLPKQRVCERLSYFVGCCFGRWDVRFASGDQPQAPFPGVFDALPVCAPGTLIGSDNLPPKQSPPSYPLSVEWDGIMIDDPDHSGDIVRRVREVLELVWKDRADAFEKEAIEVLGVKELRDYFRKPGGGGFWDDHVKRYSKSRRKAPIYWLLQSGKKNYALWLYYHRLDKDILFKALVNYVEPKVRLEDDRLTGVRTRRAGASGREVKALDRQIEKQEAFVSELRDFEDKLRRAANRHLVPDLNDGVVLNIAPLWELVPWKEAKAYWDALLAGEYEWSSIGKQLREKRLVQ